MKVLDVLLGGRPDVPLPVYHNALDQVVGKGVCPLFQFHSAVLQTAVLQPNGYYPPVEGGGG